MKQTGLHNKSGKKPEWRFNKKNGKLVRESKTGGIDWYRYGQIILMKKLFPFAQECKKDRLNTIVQEDKALAHAHHTQTDIYSIFDILQMLWPGNSPDLNAIELTWAFMKHATTCYGPPRT